MKARDFAEIVQAICILFKKSEYDLKVQQNVNINKEIKVVAQRTALMMPKMTKQS